MAENITNELLYEVLKKIQGKLNFMADDITDIKARMVTMERNPGNDRDRHQ